MPMLTTTNKITESERDFLNSFIDDIRYDHHEILYLVRFGSHLYGTNSETSDADFKGIFLPSKESCLMHSSPKSFTLSTGDKGKNSAEDIDVQLWSVQYWFKLLEKGETNAIDLLYSFSYRDMIIIKHHFMSSVWENHSKFFDIKNCNSYVGYAIGQARKYGIKGSRLGALKKVRDYINNIKIEWGMTLGDVISDIISSCGDSSFCFEKTLTAKNGRTGTFLFLCGAKHDVAIRLTEFKERIDLAYKRYGERAQMACNNEGVDFKALSHALRALDQMEMLLTNGHIQYPLDTADELRKVKNGEYDWLDVERMINDGLLKIDHLKEHHDQPKTFTSDFTKNLILSMYRR